MNNSNSAIRRRNILDSLSRCDNPATRESLLVDRIIELEDSLLELEQTYAEVCRVMKKMSCVHSPF